MTILDDRPGLTNPDAPGAALAPGPRDATHDPAASDQAASTEAQRLAILAGHRGPDTPAEAVFDDLVQAAAELFDVPMAAINLVAGDRQWTKAAIGLGTAATVPASGLCAQAIRLTGGLIVPDATADPRFAGDPLVTGPAHLRFYAAEVLLSREGHPLGTFFVADTTPHPAGLDRRQRLLLRTLCRQAASQLESRRAAIERDAAHRADADFLRGVLDSCEDCIEVLDLAGRSIFMSEGGLRAVGLHSYDQRRGLDWRAHWKDEAGGAADAAYAAACAGGTGRFRGQGKSTLKWWDVQITPILDGAGRPEKLLSVARDISDLTQTESRLARSEERLTLALRVTDLVGLWDWDLSADIVYADATLARMYDIDPEIAAGGLHITEFVARNLPQDAADPQVSHTLLEGGMEDHTREFRVRQRDGSIRWLWSRGRVVRNAEGTPVRLPGATVDITDRKLAEARLREANERLEERVAAALAARAEIEETLRQSQKMEAVGQLTGGLAHDFNNLLASISGALEIMQTRLAQKRVDKLDRYIDAAQGAARRASALTHRLLAFSRRQTLDPRPTDVNQLLAGMQDLICRTAGPEIAVEMVAGQALANALIDPNQLENALLNLCINARDAMPSGGRLTIRTADCRLDELAIRADLPVGQYTRISVGDTGTGMPPDIVSRAFDPFFTTKPLGKGTGLGLSMVYGFVRQSGGTIAIDSAPGAGTNVSLYLPRHLGAAGPAEAVVGPGAAALADGSETILIVDDEPTLRMLVAEVLQDRGYQTLEAADGAGALALLRSPARIDLLVTDVGLPGGMNGRQVADAARSLRSALKVLFITGYAETAVLGDGQLDPGMEVLTKPFAMEALAARVRAMIARH